MIVTVSWHYYTLKNQSISRKLYRTQYPESVTHGEKERADVMRTSRYCWLVETKALAQSVKGTQSNICHVSDRWLHSSSSTHPLHVYKIKRMFFRVFLPFFSCSRIWTAAPAIGLSVSCQKTLPHTLTHKQSGYLLLTTVVRRQQWQHILLSPHVLSSLHNHGEEFWSGNDLLPAIAVLAETEEL